MQSDHRDIVDGLKWDIARMEEELDRLRKIEAAAIEVVDHVTDPVITSSLEEALSTPKPFCLSYGVTAPEMFRKPDGFVEYGPTREVTIVDVHPFSPTQGKVLASKTIASGYHSNEVAKQWFDEMKPILEYQLRHGPKRS